MGLLLGTGRVKVGRGLLPTLLLGALLLGTMGRLSTAGRGLGVTGLLSTVPGRGLVPTPTLLLLGLVSYTGLGLGLPALTGRGEVPTVLEGLETAPVVGRITVLVTTGRGFTSLGSW